MEVKLDMRFGHTGVGTQHSVDKGNKYTASFLVEISSLMDEGNDKMIITAVNCLLSKVKSEYGPDIYGGITLVYQSDDSAE